MKILLSGVSGIGKTTMANHISELYKIPFIQGSSKVLWDKLKISSHKELIDRCNHNPEFAIDFQYRLLEYRREQMMKHESFVTDRSPLDNLVYFLLQISFNTDQETTSKYIQECTMSYPNDFLQLYLGYDWKMANEKELEHDTARITNAYYQLMVGKLFDTVLEYDWLKLGRFHRVDTWDFEKRCKWVDNQINNKYGTNTKAGSGSIF